MGRAVAVVGGGIVGTAVARELARHPTVDVTVWERDPSPARGSTAFAPGFVGIYNDAHPLTELARSSAATYESVGRGYRRSGGLELATSPSGAAELERRVADAMDVGLPAAMLPPAEVPTSVAGWLETDALVAAAHFPADGVAVPPELLAALRDDAVASGARFAFAQEVTGVGRVGRGYEVTTSSGASAVVDDVVLAGGVWGPSLADLVGLDLPLYPVAHPYVYSAPRANLAAGPFVRWPEHHVYARVHGDRLGIGSYDHAPVPVSQEGLHEGAGLPWDGGLDAPLLTARALLHPGARFEPDRRVNGVFAMTPDNLPFLGAHPGAPGVWVAQAIWITHAAGAAAALVEAMVHGGTVAPAFAVGRFDAVGSAELRSSALRLYRDIYGNDT